MGCQLEPIILPVVVLDNLQEPNLKKNEEKPPYFVAWLNCPNERPFLGLLTD